MQCFCASLGQCFYCNPGSWDSATGVEGLLCLMCVQKIFAIGKLWKVDKEQEPWKGTHQYSSYFINNENTVDSGTNRSYIYKPCKIADMALGSGCAKAGYKRKM